MRDVIDMTELCILLKLLWWLTPRKTRWTVLRSWEPKWRHCTSGQFTEGISTHPFPKVRNSESEADKQRELSCAKTVEAVCAIKIPSHVNPSGRSVLYSADSESANYSTNPDI